MNNESSRFLLALVQEHGYVLTESQLRRLHLKGVIARPIQEHPDGRVGSETIYPSGTGTIILAFCQRRKEIRSLSALAWQLWWDGYQVPITSIRQQLRQTIESWTRSRRILVKPGTKVLSRMARKALAKAATYRFHEPSLNQARKRVGTVSFDTFIRILFEAATGNFHAYSDDAREEEQSIMEKGFGLKQTPLDRTLHLDWGAQLEQALVDLGKLLAEDPWISWLDYVSDAELFVIREELKLVQTAFSSFYAAVEDMIGKRAFGASVLYQLLGRVSHKNQPFLFLCWGILRQHMATNTQEILRIARQWQEESLPAYTALRQLQQEIPSSRELFTSNGMKALMGSERMREQHLAKCQRFYQSHQEELTAFWQRHPEWAQLWDQQAGDSAC